MPRQSPARTDDPIRPIGAQNRFRATPAQPNAPVNPAHKTRESPRLQPLPRGDDGLRSCWEERNRTTPDGAPTGIAGDD